MVRRWDSIDIRLRLVLLAIIIALILAPAWYLGSPLFIDRTVDESFPGRAAADPALRVQTRSMFASIRL